MPQIGEPDAAGSADAAPPPAPAAEESEPLSTAADLLDEIDPEKARPYSEADTYEVGDVIHHRAWNDYGIVKAVESLPGNRRIIRVRFVNAGEVQLLEGQDL